jgi:hypothetical protein
MIESGELMLVKFDLQRIKKEVKCATDLDNAHVTFIPNLFHCRCLSYETYFNLVMREGASYLFQQSVYFHPNFGVDGWESLRGWYGAAKAKWEGEKTLYAKKQELKKKKKNEKKRDVEKEKKDKVKFNRIFPGFPLQPKFWDLNEEGSSVFLWPPRLFKPWVDDVKNGKVLTLAPAAPNPSSTDHPDTPNSRAYLNFSTNAVAGSSSGPGYNAGFGPGDILRDANTDPGPSSGLSDIEFDRQMKMDDILRDTSYSNGGISDSDIAAMAIV